MLRLDNLIVSLLLTLSVASAQEFVAPPTEFLPPNEVNPELASPILAHAPSGAYITVGTERGFIHAAESPEVTHLVFFDRSPGIVLFNKMNTELLRASWSAEKTVAERRERYRFLRLEASFEEWQNAVGKFEYLSQRNYFDWFTKAARGRGFLDFNTPPKTSYLASFRNANYLFDDRMFEKLQKMALDGKIESHELDLGSEYGSFNEKGITEFLADLAHRKIPISVFDLSNAWVPKYLSPKLTAKLGEMLAASPMASPRSIFLVTDYTRNQYYKNGERAKAGWFTTKGSDHINNAHYEYDWRYHGYTFQYLNANPLLDVLKSKIPKGNNLNDQIVDCDQTLLK